MAVEVPGVLRQDIALISRLFDCSPKDLNIDRLPGGETNRNHLVAQGDARFVVRIPYDDDFVDRGNEAINISALLSNRYTSRFIPAYRSYVYWERDTLSAQDRMVRGAPDGLAAAREIEGRDITIEDLEDFYFRNEIARTIYMLHQSGVVLTPYDPFASEISRYKDIVNSSRVAIPGIDSHEINQINELTVVLDGNLPKVDPTPSHNDLEFGNIRMGRNGNIYLLDPEYAGACNRGPVYDWGTFLGENPMTVDILEAVLSLSPVDYRKDIDIKLVTQAALVNWIVTFWWGSVKYLKAEVAEREKYTAYVRERADRILAQNVI